MPRSRNRSVWLGHGLAYLASVPHMAWLVASGPLRERPNSHGDTGEVAVVLDMEVER